MPLNDVVSGMTVHFITTPITKSELGSAACGQKLDLGPDAVHRNHRFNLETQEFTGSSGRLSQKREAAGKIRVFAMVDW